MTSMITQKQPQGKSNAKSKSGGHVLSFPRKRESIIMFLDSGSRPE
jgi:hypothetical protein